MYFLQFVANASQQTIYNMSLCAVWTTVFERLGQKVCCDYLRGGRDTDRLEDVW